jgi:hypothetical protein
MILKCKNCGKEFNTSITRTTKYCSRSCYAIKKRGPLNHNWKGGKRLTNWGYIYVKAPYNHPHKNNSGYIFEHRLVMEKHLNRYLEPFEFVHHINGIKTDNRIENLIVITKAQHNTAHFKGKPSHKKGKHRNPNSYSRDPRTGRYI